MGVTHYFFWNPTAVIRLEDEEFKLLWFNMSHHYDGTVKDATKCGGFMYGCKNNREWQLENKDLVDLDVHVNHRQLQLLIKSLEMDRDEQAINLSERLWNIINEMKEKHKRINNL